MTSPNNGGVLERTQQWVDQIGMSGRNRNIVYYEDQSSDENWNQME